MFEMTIEPVVLRGEADQHARGAPVTSDHDFFLDGEAKVLR